MTLKEKILAYLMDPNIAFLLLAIGALSLYLEFNHPGAVIPPSTLLPGRFLPLQRRSRGALNPICWLGTGLGLANHWRCIPVSIPCASGVHIGNMATCYLGGSLKLLWPFRDSGAGLQIKSLPAILFLAGDDEDLLAGARFAKLGLVEVRNLAKAANRRRQQAEVGDIPALVAAAAARLLAEYHNVLVQLPRNHQIKPHPIRAVLSHQPPHVTARKHRAHGDLQGFRQAHDSPHGADGLPELLARQRRSLGEPGVGHHLSPRSEERRVGKEG